MLTSWMNTVGNYDRSAGQSQTDQRHSICCFSSLCYRTNQLQPPARTLHPQSDYSFSTYGQSKRSQATQLERKFSVEGQTLLNEQLTWRNYTSPPRIKLDQTNAPSAVSRHGWHQTKARSNWNYLKQVIAVHKSFGSYISQVASNGLH